LGSLFFVIKDSGLGNIQQANIEGCKAIEQGELITQISQKKYIWLIKK
jgi:hypothetical protein